MAIKNLFVSDFTIGPTQMRVKYPIQFHRYIEFSDNDVQSSPQLIIRPCHISGPQLPADNNKAPVSIQDSPCGICDGENCSGKRLSPST